jgi:hypothetical protein
LALVVTEFTSAVASSGGSTMAPTLASDEPVLRQVAEKRNCGGQAVALFRLDRHLSIRHISMDQRVDQRLIRYPLLASARDFRRTRSRLGMRNEILARSSVIVARAIASISRLRLSASPLLERGVAHLEGLDQSLLLGIEIPTHLRCRAPARSRLIAQSGGVVPY